MSVSPVPMSVSPPPCLRWSHHFPSCPVFIRRLWCWCHFMASSETNYVIWCSQVINHQTLETTTPTKLQDTEYQWIYYTGHSMYVIRIITVVPYMFFYHYHQHSSARHPVHHVVIAFPYNLHRELWTNCLTFSFIHLIFSTHFYLVW